MSVPTIRRQRPVTAKVAAERLGVSVRTIRRYVSEERSTYEGRAAERREKAGRLHEAGKSWEEIAEALGGTHWTARALVRRWKAEQEEAQANEPAPPSKPKRLQHR